MRTIALWAFVALSLAACSGPLRHHVNGGVALGRSAFEDDSEVDGNTRALRVEYAAGTAHWFELGGRLSIGESSYSDTTPTSPQFIVDFDGFDVTAEIVPRFYFAKGSVRPWVELFAGVRSSTGDVGIQGAGQLDVDASGFVYGQGVGVEFGDESGDGGFTIGAVYRGGQLDVDIDQVPSFDADLEEILFVMAVGGRW